MSNHTITSPKYLKINIIHFYEFVGEEDADKIKKLFIDHHCDIYHKEGMFVFERFFPNTVYEAEDYDEEGVENIHTLVVVKLKEFLTANGFTPYEPEKWLEGDCLIPDHDGILFDVTW